MAKVVRGSSYGSPGLSGALKDLGRAVMGQGKDNSGAGGRQRDAAIDDVVDEASTGSDSLGRMKAAQSTDRDNSYQY